MIKPARLLFDIHCRVVFTLMMIFALLTPATAEARALDSTFGAYPSSALPVATAATFSQLNLYPNIETIGVAVTGVSLPTTAQLTYRQTGQINWSPGHPLKRIDDGRLIGSLFNLSPSTSYDVKVLDGATEISGTVTTQPDQLQFAPSVVLHVKASAPAGGDGSVATPFNTIQEAVNHATPGTQVLVADGVYHEAVTFPASGASTNWIQVKAEGTAAILDGSQKLTGSVWTADSNAHVWFTKISKAIAYLARDGARFYMYDDRSGLMQSRGHNGVTITEGWYFEPSTLRLYVRSQDDPSNHSWQVPILNHAFDIGARDWIWIEGFEMRYYGTTTNGCGVCTLNASHIVVRGNKIHNLQLGIFINWTGTDTQGNDTRIENNEIYDPPVNEWPWDAVKTSSMEGTAVIIRGHIGAIVRGNNVHNYFNGIYTGSSGALENPALAFDADIYNNHIHHISDDGLEPEGACVNQRFRNNVVDNMLIGISFAPITQGPTWVMRNSFASFTGSSIKWASNSDGIILFYHNTSWTNASGLNAMSTITATHNAVMRNNIFQGNGYAFEEVSTGSSGHDWNRDDWYTTHATPHFKWENVNYNNIAQLCAGTGLECNGYEDAPGLTNPSGGNFMLLSSSPNIDRGIVIPGINDDFKGNAPDIGAYEVTTVSFPKVLSSVRASANPTNATNVNFTVTFSSAVTGVDIVAPFSDFGLTIGSGIAGAFISSVTPVSGTTYTVNVNTGSGNGTIRLDVIDDDSVVDSGAHPLGGAGAGNGNFITGEVYTVSKSVTNPVTVTFNSTASYDGWILESGENTSVGNKLDKSATTIYLGDDAKDKQYRSILSFNTVSLPDNAIMVSAQVKIKRQGLVGTDPFTTHGVLQLQVINGAFSGSAALQAGDFSAAAGAGSVRDAVSALTSSWYASNLSNTNLGYVNKYGITQFRLSFAKDDNDDMSADYMKFFSGDYATSGSRPQLIITYYVP